MTDTATTGIAQHVLTEVRNGTGHIVLNRPRQLNALTAQMYRDLKDALDVQTAPIVALGLLGGYVTARESGIRPLGGAVLAAAGVYAGRTWLAGSSKYSATAVTNRRATS